LGQAIIPVDDYAIYDRVVTNKFLTSQTKLVLIQRVTASRLYLDQDGPTTLGMFDEQAYFDRRLPPELVREFVFKNRQPARMGGYFDFGVPYRFVSADGEEESTVSRAIPATWVPAVSVQDLSLLGRLVFSRVAYTLRSDQALVYVEQHRPDGTGAGLLVWLLREGPAWSIRDTEVLWSLREQSRGQE
jgi:hypothetical protein